MVVVVVVVEVAVVAMKVVVEVVVVAMKVVVAKALVVALLQCTSKYLRSSSISARTVIAIGCHHCLIV